MAPSELIVLAGLVAIALWMPVLLLAHGIGWRELSSYGLYPDDQFQYFAWIRDMGDHGLASNLWDAPRSTPHDFLHPGLLINGLGYRAGIPIPISYGLWVPVALALLFASVRAYVTRLVDAGFARAAALAIALLGFSPLVPVTNWLRGQRGGGLRVGSLDAWTGGLLSGYPISAVAVALLPVALLRLERWRRGEGARQLAWACAAAAFAAWFHPWQGQTLGLTVLLVEARLFLRARRRPPVTGLLVFAVSLSLPLLYYAALGRFDGAWADAAANSALALTPHLAVLVVGMLLPFLVLAVFGYRTKTDDWQQLAVRAWPIAAMVLLLQPSAGHRLHVLEGITIPLGVLGASIARTPFGRRCLGLALVVLCVPGSVLVARAAAFRAHAPDYYINRDEGRALSAVAADERPGAVLAPTGAFGAPSAWIPYRTGREVAAGSSVWSSPQSRVEVIAAYERNSADAILGLARKFRARFVVGDCRFSRRRLLLPPSQRVRAFGCVRVLARNPPALARS